MSRRTDSLNAYEVALTSGVSDVDTSFPVESTVGLIAPGYLVVDPDDPTKREYFKYTIINGANLQFPDTGFRGLRGSAAGAQGHLAGARVRAVAVGQWLDDIFSDIEDLEAEQAAFLDLAGTRAMFGDLNMGDNKIEVLATPVLDDDATTKLYVDAADLLLLDLAGTRAMTGDLDMGTNQIKNMADPTVPQDAATVKWTNDQLAMYLPLDGSDPMTGALTIEVDDANIAFLSADGASRGYRLKANVSDITDEGLEFNNHDGVNLLILKGADADVSPNTLISLVPFTSLANMGIRAPGENFSIVTGRVEALTLRSGETNANATHSFIAFQSSSAASSAQIVTWQGSSSDQLGLKINTSAAGNVEALFIKPNGATIVGAVPSNNVDSADGPTVRNVWWRTTVPGGGDGNKGDMAVVEGNGIYIKRLTTTWAKVASL
jgi:hypothetical protein